MMGSNNHKGPEAATGLLGPLVTLEATYRAFDAALGVLEGAIGVPICVLGCGKCCAVNVPMVWRVEAHLLASWLLGQGAEPVDRVVSVCEGWLLERHPSLTSRGFSGVKTLSLEEQERLRPEVDSVMMGSPCPLLATDKSCMVHEARPLVCRAYGVTRLPAYWCPRPLATVESNEARAHISDDSALGKKLYRMVEQVVRRGAERTGARFLPTALYELFRPAKLRAYVENGLIASAKLVVMQKSTSIVFQRELNVVWEAEARKVSSFPGVSNTSEGGVRV